MIENNNGSIRSLRFILSLPWWFLVFFSIESALLISKKPEWFELYSPQKLIFLLFSFCICFFLFFIFRKVNLNNKCLLFWQKLSSHYLTIFFISASLCLIVFVKDGVQVGEDIGGQVKSSMQWIEGKVNTPNFLQSPNQNDLSDDSTNWNLRPPGAALLAVPGMMFGLSLGHSIQSALFACSIAGGIGWIYLLRGMGLCSPTILLVSILLGLMAGSNTSNFSTANIILYALVPWFLVWLSRLSVTLSVEEFSGKRSLLLACFLFCLGCFSWVKLSGIIAAGTIGAAMFFLILLHVGKRLQATFKFALLGLLFWLPFAGLEGLNFSFSGKTADQAYKSVVSDIEAPLTGKHWMGSTNGGWLLWSFVAAPGYALPTKSIAIGIRDLGKQFQGFRIWMNKKKINDHVFLAGSLSIFLTVLLIFEIKSVFSLLELTYKNIVLCFCIFPFIGLAVLSNRFQWNYLMYHAHTFEYWLVFAIPSLTILSKAKYVGLRTYLLIGIILAFPIYKNAQTLAYKLFPIKNYAISETEIARGLSQSRFSDAIQRIEEDSVNTQDILFFLPTGDSADLLLRTKMRTISTHFSGDNFPNVNKFKTTRTLNVYCAYDSSLSSNKVFLEALKSKFPQATNREIIYSENVIVSKITLVPNHNG